MAKGVLHDGLKKPMDCFPDTPRTKGGSVNSKPTRKGTAPTPKSLGPRTA